VAITATGDGTTIEITPGSGPEHQVTLTGNFEF